MSDYQYSPPPPEFDPGYNQFGPVATELLGLIHDHPDFYADKGTFMLEKLDQAKAALEKGQISANDVRRISLFGGLQADNVDWPHESEGNRIVEKLYLLFSRMAGYNPQDYDDIEKDALDLASQNLIVDETLDVRYLGLGQLVRGDRMALVGEDKRLKGIRLKISDNMVASFALGNFGSAGKVGQMTYVDLYVVPSF